MTESLTERLSRCYTGVVHDVMRGRGLADFTLPPEITPLVPEKVLCGPVFTIEGHVDDRAEAHQTLLEWTGLLSKAIPGHIWVCQPNDRVIAQMGELSAETLQKKGVLGCVIDGNIRDVNFILKIGFQCWRRRHTPRDVVGRWLPRGFDVPITIGDVLIRPGDYLIGDRDGVIRVPRELVGAVTDEAAVAMNTENKVRKAILDGMDPREAYLTYGKF
ncbi:RraA family protein [Bradyrhizobium brasilense]|uniref:RraA family protein n=1 Tax=Bradyrhizobium brasilense TaxID=1419277 RepID=UPI001E2DA1C5|nr:RraA family protein [Bradyrhizobium brasilense]MCC8974320.1 RraA family protein [Bradyrhizobium brasilense]